MTNYFFETMRQTFLLLMLILPLLCYGQQDTSYKYERGSLDMMMIRHPNLSYNNEIEYVFSKMKIPDRFNDHDLGVRVVQFAEDRDQVKNIQSFINQVQLGKKLVAKWFDRNKETKGFDMNLVKDRGNYNATSIDVKLAKNQTRNLAIIEDAGEELIPHTYLVMNDIFYVDKSNKWQVVKDWANITTRLAETYAGASDNTTLQKENPFESSLSWMYSGLLDNIKGFKVTITSYLFRLKWNDDISQQFYNQFYTEYPNVDSSKVRDFNNNKSLFTMEYVGCVKNTSSKTVLYGVKTNEELITKVCTRALDKNIADLQHQFSDFRIKAPLVSVSPLKAYIGMKEDVSNDSKYEVLEKQTDEKGKQVYKRVGIIKPIKNKIWDNRFMATEEGSKDASLNATEFQKISGGDFLPGMLIREIK